MRCIFFCIVIVIVIVKGKSETSSARAAKAGKEKGLRLKVKGYRLRVNVVVIVDVICCQHSLFAHQTVRAAPLLRLTSAAQAGEAFGFVVIVVN